MFYRIKQFVWAVTASVTDEEYHFVKQYLTDGEVRLFEKLKVYEQKHSIKVAKAMIEEACGLPKYSDVQATKIIRIGLLHDIGKSIYPIGPIRKSIMVLADKYTKGRFRDYTILPMMKCYYQHPELGYQLLKSRGQYDESFLTVVQQHHQETAQNVDEIFYLLKKWDDLL